MKTSKFLLLTLFFFILIGGIGLFLISKNIKGITPVVLPPIKNTQAEVGLKIVDGFKVTAFAKNLGNVRNLEFSLKGVLLASIPDSGKLVALPDENNDGLVDKVVDVVTDLKKPHGFAFYNGKLFIAEETNVSSYVWDEDALKADKEKDLF